MEMRYISSAIALTLCSQIGQAWTSGGGGIVDGSAGNPWFIQNTRVVHYCLRVDGESFPQGAEKLQSLVVDALSYWQQQLKPLEGSAVRVATQEFIRGDCDDETDLRFLFGGLTAAESQIIGSPKEHIGIAIREQYDLTRMRGKGFIYISPDRGDDKFNNYNFVQNPWTKGTHGLLLRALVHELGHVFGVGHVNAEGHLMSENYLTYILNTEHANSYDAPLQMWDQIYIRSTNRSHRISTALRSMFKIPERFTNVRALCREEFSCGSAQFMATSANGDEMVVAQFTPRQVRTSTVMGSGISVYLPEIQKVFFAPPQNGGFLSVAVPVEVDMLGTLTSLADGQTWEMKVKLATQFWTDHFFKDQWGAIVDGKWIDNVLQ